MPTPATTRCSTSATDRPCTRRFRTRCWSSPRPPGSDPQGNPEAEPTVDTIAHEAVEAITDPDGTGWMDPNGFETGDKCENGPQQGTPLGYAPNGAPYNQVINGQQYLIQDMWSDARGGCVPASTVVGSTPGTAHHRSPAVQRRVSAAASERRPGAGGSR